MLQAIEAFLLAIIIFILMREVRMVRKEAKEQTTRMAALIKEHERLLLDLKMQKEEYDNLEAERNLYKAESERLLSERDRALDMMMRMNEVLLYANYLRKEGIFPENLTKFYTLLEDFEIEVDTNAPA